MNMTLSLITMISILCSDQDMIKNAKENCIKSFNQCYQENAKKDWALELIPEVRKVKVFYHCAWYQGWGQK
jgi:hypothetical protein